jgi:hypothetical protein
MFDMHVRILHAAIAVGFARRRTIGRGKLSPMSKSGAGMGASAVIVAAALALYWPASSAWFYQDDLQWLAGTLTFKPGGLLDVSAHAHFYRPVIALYFWAATPLFGGSPALFHWANSVLHAANGLLVFLLAETIGLRRGFAFLAALFFVSMPAHIEATAWVSALAEPVTTLFGLISIYALLRAHRQQRPGWKALSVASFVMALMTHESAAVLLPLLVLADWAFVQPEGPERSFRWREWGSRVRRFTPYVVLLGLYLLIDLSVNSRSYLVEEGHYRLGFHAVKNLLGYVVTLYAGKRNLPSFVVVGLVLTVLLLRGTPRVVFATAWLVLTLLPFSFFTWSNTSRYAYTPAVGMALLLAEGLQWVDTWLARVMNTRARITITAALGMFVAVRFMVFSLENIRNFSERTEPYRRFAVSIRQQHPDPAPGAGIPVDAATADALHFRYLEALAQWEFRDPTLKLVVTP